MYKFSIITVVYNGMDVLKNTVDSIQNQTYNNFEHIIVDGNSKDGTLEYIKSLAFDNLSYISERDNGIYDAMNKGANLSKGEYLLFLNAGDNFASNEILENIVRKIRDLKSKPKIIYGGANVYTENGKFLVRLNPLVLNKKNLNRFATRTVCHQSIFVHNKSMKIYSDKYRLKGELNWYYDLIAVITQNEILQTDEVICDYYLGGTGDKNFIENYFERINVAKVHNNLVTFIAIFPFFLIPLIFRIRRILVGK
jgi:glycosyltransferase involved in cell wall biosynthesis